MKNWTFKKHVITIIMIVVVLFTIQYASFKLFIYNLEEGSHIEESAKIIGGADGPTAIFLASNTSPSYGPVIFIIGLIFLYVPIKYYKKKS